MAKGHVKTGTYTGNGAAQNIELGFAPDFLIVCNITDGTEVFFWFSGMTAATAIIMNTAAATQGSNAVTAFAGTAATTGLGVTVGTAMSTNAKVYRYIAITGVD